MSWMMCYAWKEADSFFKEHLVSRVLMQSTADVMNDVLCITDPWLLHQEAPNNITTRQQSNHHHQHPSKVRGQHQRILKAVKEEKRQAKKQLRALRRSGRGAQARTHHPSIGAEVQQTVPWREAQGKEAGQAGWAQSLPQQSLEIFQSSPWWWRFHQYTAFIHLQDCWVLLQVHLQQHQHKQVIQSARLEAWCPKPDGG